MNIQITVTYGRHKLKGPQQQSKNAKHNMYKNPIGSCPEIRAVTFFCKNKIPWSFIPNKIYTKNKTRYLKKSAATLLTVSDIIPTHERISADEREMALLPMMNLALESVLKL